MLYNHRLQDKLAGPENRIAVERQRFNEAVRAYKTRIRSFPTNLVAGLWSRKDRKCRRFDSNQQRI